MALPGRIPNLAAPDLAQRVHRPNHLWVADPYIPTKAGFLYLAAVIDVWSRRGRLVHAQCATPLVTDALDSSHGANPTGCLGVPNTPPFRARCEQAGVRCRWDAEATPTTTQ